MGEEKTVFERCEDCGGNYRHNRLLYEQKRSFADDEDGLNSRTVHHQMIECMGCRAIRYRTYTIAHHEGEDEYSVPTFVYPSKAKSKCGRAAADFTDTETLAVHAPKVVERIYNETIDCFNAGAYTLAGGGLRATVEAICKDLGVVDGALQTKIDELVKKSFLTANQAKLLHEERYIGNAALHELESPTKEELEDGLQIIETMIRTIYLLEVKADRLRKIREKKAKKGLKSRKR